MNLDPTQVRRVRQVVEQTEQIVKKLQHIVQPIAEEGHHAFLIARLRRTERHLADLDRALLELIKVAQDALMARYLHDHPDDHHRIGHQARAS